jgi:preprotein translocase subunit SecE
MSEATAMTKATAWPGQIKKYAGELRDEMRLVTWPSWKQVRATTGVVIGAVFIFSLCFLVVDQGVSWLVKQVFDRFTT